MRNLLRQWFGKAEPSAHPPVTVILQFDEDGAGEQSGAGVQAGETLDKIHEEFCRTFCHRPGVNLMDQLRAEGPPELIEWLHWKNNEAETMSFLTLAVDATRKGIHFWEQSGITGYRGGGRPSQQSADALATLARILGLRIRLFYEEKPGGKMMVWEFLPDPS